MEIKRDRKVKQLFAGGKGVLGYCQIFIYITAKSRPTLKPLEDPVIDSFKPRFDWWSKPYLITVQKVLPSRDPTYFSFKHLRR